MTDPTTDDTVTGMTMTKADMRRVIVALNNRIAVLDTEAARYETKATDEDEVYRINASSGSRNVATEARNRAEKYRSDARRQQKTADNYRGTADMFREFIVNNVGICDPETES